MDINFLIEENNTLKQLLRDLLPDLLCRKQSISECWPGREILLEGHRIESLIVRVNTALSNHDPS